MPVEKETRNEGQIFAQARNLITAGADHRFDNEALLRIERQVRQNLDVCGHNLSFETRLYEALRKEHKSILVQVKERKLAVLTDPIFHQ